MTPSNPIPVQAGGPDVPASSGHVQKTTPVSSGIGDFLGGSEWLQRATERHERLCRRVKAGDRSHKTALRRDEALRERMAAEHAVLREGE